MKIKKNALLATAVVAVGLSAAPAVAQQQAANGADEVKVTVGLKLWHTSWETWGNPPGNTAQREFAGIPNIAVNYGDFFGSAGYFVKREYDFPGSLQVKRNEYDVNLGYWLLKGEAGGRLGVTVGYKRINQWWHDPFFTDFKDKKNAIPFGFTASAPVGSGFYLYGNGAYGPANEKFLGTKIKGYFAAAEGGVAYPFMPNAAVTLGYKWQITDMDLKGSSDRGRDTTNGFVLGVNYTF